jgi:hypothetical protein
MRVNVYAEEMTDRVEIISKTIDGHEFTGLRLYLELPTSLPKGVHLSGPTPDVNAAYFEPPTDQTHNVKGPFMHRPGDDDSAAITFWGKRDLRHVLRAMLAALDAHYDGAQNADSDSLRIRELVARRAEDVDAYSHASGVCAQVEIHTWRERLSKAEAAKLGTFLTIASGAQ